MFSNRILALNALFASTVAVTPFERVVIYSDGDGFAAREIRRYTYLTTGSVPTLHKCVGMIDQSCCTAAIRNTVGEVVVVASPDSPTLDLIESTTAAAEASKLDEMAGGHIIQSTNLLVDSKAYPAVLIVGAGQFGRLYAAYSYAEALGVRFELAGDILPDPTGNGGLKLSRSASSPLPPLEVSAATPVFQYRGLQPFHDFPEGPDWWDTQHYKQIISQLSKQKANFIGLHTYPYRSGIPATGSDEPTVWVGAVDNLEPDGSVKPEGAYPTSYANTLRNEWGYGSMNTSSYSWGTSELFETDCWAPAPTDESSCPYPANANAAAAFFERTAAMLNDSFSYGNMVGVQSCLGTETPLSSPLDPDEGHCTVGSATCYQDTVSRVMPHTVTIHSDSNSLEWCANQCSLAGYTLAGVEYAVACFCGNSTPTSKKLDPSQCAMKCAGNASENCGDSYTISVYDFKCASTPTPPAPSSPYDGIFTRLKLKIPSLTWYWVWTPEGWEWGHMSSSSPTFTEAVHDLELAMQSRDAIWPDLKMMTNGWVVGPLPDRSIFDKTLPTSWDAITSIDLNTGHNPVDPAYKNITRHAKWAIPWMEDDPDLTAPQLWVNRTLEHMEDAQSYGCSGLLGIHWRTKETGPQISAMLQKGWDATLTSTKFWQDWSVSSFGEDVGPSVAAIFESVDSFKMPLVVGWSGGPGKLSPHCGVKPSTFDFVSQLEAIAPRVSGVANAARFGFWLEHFRYMRGISSTECAWSQFDTALASAQKVPSATNKAALLAARIALVSNATAMITSLQLSFADIGTLGTYMNVEGHSLYTALIEPEDELHAILGTPLPAAATRPKVFGGPNATLVAPTVRTTLGAHEPFELRILALVPVLTPSCHVTLYTKPLASSQAFSPTPFTNVARSVFEVSAGVQTGDFEYYVSLSCASGHTAVYPAGAPTITQTVVYMD